MGHLCGLRGAKKLRQSAREKVQELADNDNGNTKTADDDEEEEGDKSIKAPRKSAAKSRRAHNTTDAADDEGEGEDN